MHGYASELNATPKAESICKTQEIYRSK